MSVRSVRRDGVAKAPEDALLGGAQLTDRALLATYGGELLEQFLLALVELRRRLHDHGHDQVAATAAQTRDAPALDHVVGARLGSRAYVQREGAVLLRRRLAVGLQRRQGQLGAQRRRGRRERHDAVELVALAGEEFVLLDPDLDVQVAGRAGAHTDLTLLGEMDPGAVVDARRDRDLERLVGAYAALAGAVAARVGDDGSVSLAGRTRAERTNLAEEGARRLGDLAGTAAGLT